MTPDLAAPRARALPSQTATIHALDSTSFTTDLQQKWRSPTPSLAPATSQNQYNNSFNQDFQLFAAPEPLRVSSSPTALRAQAISSITPNRSAVPSRHLSINSSVSPTQSIQSPYLGQLNSGNQHRSYSSPALHQAQNLRQLAHLQRLPPVPSFNFTASTKNREIHTTPQVPGNYCNFPPQNLLLTSTAAIMTTAFDSMFLPGGDSFTSQDDYLVSDFDFTTVNSATNPNDGTISPSDLFNDDAIIMSAPPSTAFPNLSTPDSGYLDSPATLGTTPLEDGLLDGQLNFDDLDSMAPLFPPTESYDQFGKQSISSESIVQHSFNAVNSNTQSNASPMVRQKSSPGRPPSIPFSHGRKHSDAYGVNKGKSRKSLPEIKIESEDDKETAKRKKNTAAARKSRMRKQEHAEASESEIQRLRAIIYRMGGDPDEGH